MYTAARNVYRVCCIQFFRQLTIKESPLLARDAPMNCPLLSSKFPFAILRWVVGRVVGRVVWRE